MTTNNENFSYSVETKASNAAAIMDAVLESLETLAFKAEKAETKKDLLIVNYCCTVDLVQNCKMLYAIRDILQQLEEAANQINNDTEDEAA